MATNNMCQKGKIVVIVKPIVECNLDCVYCYEGDNPYKNQRMEYETLKNMITKFAQYNGRGGYPTEFIWHGGEPLLMGIKFYEKAFELQKSLEPEYNFSNGIQTNATLLNKDFADLFEEHNVAIGFSMDGPQPLHDVQRPYQDGKGSFDDVMTSFNLVNESNHKSSKRVKNNGTLAILTQNTSNNLEKFYSFFHENQLNVRVNPLFFRGKAVGVKDSLGLSPAQIGKTMVELFDQWFNENEPKFFIKPFDELIHNLVTGYPQSCMFTGDCYNRFLKVAPNGDIYLCAQWPLKAYCLGNINTHDIDEMLASPHVENLKEQREQAKKKCAQCSFSNACNSGCIRHGYSRRESFSDRDYHCPYYKQFFTHLNKVLSQELKTSVFPTRDIDIDSVQNNTLKKIIQTRIPTKGDAPCAWSDTNWSQWRGDYPYSDWQGNWDATWDKNAIDSRYYCM